MNSHWSKEEILFLEQSRSEGKTIKEIAIVLARSINAIKLQISRLKIIRGYICLGCGIKEIDETGHRLRCEPCAVESNKLKKRAYDMTPHMIKHRTWKRNLERFGGNREKALERDLYTCQKCGANHHIKKLEVHHIDKQGRHKEIQNHDLNNLLTVCASCHIKIHKEDIMSKRWPKK